MTLGLAAVGTLPGGLLERLAGFLGARLPVTCRRLATVLDPAPALDLERAQYNCRELLPRLEELAGERAELVLGVADVDLYSPLFTFVFGEARLGGRAGIASIYRLRPALYGLPDDPLLLEARARREVLHEVGHLLGLPHCLGPACAMRFSGAAEEVDLKEDRLCGRCQAAVETGSPAAAKCLTRDAAC